MYYILFINDCFFYQNTQIHVCSFSFMSQFIIHNRNEQQTLKTCLQVWFMETGACKFPSRKGFGKVLVSLKSPIDYVEIFDSSIRSEIMQSISPILSEVMLPASA